MPVPVARAIFAGPAMIEGRVSIRTRRPSRRDGKA